jgi:hypothetical protein
LYLKNESYKLVPKNESYKLVPKKLKLKATSIKLKATSIKLKATSIKLKASSIKLKAGSHWVGYKNTMFFRDFPYYRKISKGTKNGRKKLDVGWHTYRGHAQRCLMRPWHTDRGHAQRCLNEPLARQ